ncbi:hypothetical protein LTR91_008308 [Friedmanniomyces endolithicus]|uniref:Myb-like DNA-binding domain-containing protein n=1 Tax=Friedmanniomyces endolithicus TaxID=329885 RepID=A0AAN6FUT7_9PEZI|nr:hypothetical protein LTR35_007801 [Friedmanniomyces endolithicus]KAK0282585.1 hypothetical protein LTS00_012097 [Friedmanniomyces endolithicus]KAK0304544.1 hypothetical protein LTR01_007337 [Friedmanniomyces endolithicus]KAK0324675.1 hypothetical protein LTR82_004380 [Friedmanniomyces endolithicus]KAK0826688.1 hypothetical protein LTR73_006022 [Friedmanniomyces endolithicus]
MAKESAPAVTDEGFFMAIIEQLGGTNAIDWQVVADRSNIVSKGAASKRWYRLKLKHGQEVTGKDRAITDAVAGAFGTTVADGDEEAPKKKKQPAKKGNTKKRKGPDQTDEDGAEAGQKRVKTEMVEGDDGVWQRFSA